MSNPSVMLGKPLMEEMTSPATHCRKALTSLSFALGLFLVVLLTLLPWASTSEAQHSAVTMASIMPQHQMAFGKKVFLRQSGPLPPFQPSLSRQQPLKSMRVSAEVFNPQTFGETTEKFQNALPRFLPPLFQAFISDYLSELHFYVFNQKYNYDGMFALGLREFFDAGSGAYEKLAGDGEAENLWSAVCDAVGLDAAKVKADAETMRSYAKSTPPADILKNMEGTEKPSDSLVASAFDKTENDCQFRSVGLFKVMEFSGVGLDKDKAKEWSKAAKMDNGKFMKDLQLFRTSLRRMQEGEEVLKGMTERAKKKKEEAKKEEAA